MLILAKYIEKAFILCLGFELRVARLRLCFPHPHNRVCFSYDAAAICRII